MLNKFFDYLENFFSKRILKEKEETELLLLKCNNSIIQKDYNILKLESDIKVLEDMVVGLQENIDFLEQKNILDERAEYWNNKYPSANIDYLGRTFGTSKTRIPIDVRLLITPQDFKIHDILKKNNLYYKGGSVDDHIIKIYHFIKNEYYRYVYDSNNYGVNEYWEFPFEMLEGLKQNLTIGFDCDSWANFIASFLIASGIPNWKVRVVVGGTQSVGHSTVYCHSDVSNRFHHINSTYGAGTNKKVLSEYPVSDDALTSDPLGIKSVWFSFNDEFAWHKFTSEAKKDFETSVKGKKLYDIKKKKKCKKENTNKKKYSC